MFLENQNNDFVFTSRYIENAGSEDDTIVTLFGNKFFTFRKDDVFFKNNWYLIYVCNGKDWVI